MTTIHPGMFDHCTTIQHLDNAWMTLRAQVPQWHNDGSTRAELANARAHRADQIRSGLKAVA